MKKKKKLWCGYVESDDDGYEQDNCKSRGKEESGACKIY